VGLHRSAYYYQPVAADQQDLLLMRLLDEQYLLMPFYGYRKMQQVLAQAGYQVNHKRVQKLMQVVGIEAIYCKPNTSKPTPGHRIYPYLLRGLAIVRVHQVWATDITYVPMPTGYMYLIAIIDLYSRYVLKWSVSNTMTADWCSQVLTDALMLYPAPTIFIQHRPGQSIHGGSLHRCAVLEAGIQISMDGKGRAIDNIFVERLWRTVKYEDIYVKAYADGWALEAGLRAYFTFYNSQRFHQGLAYQTPEQVFGKGKKEESLQSTNTFVIQ
jgi:putative transposase